MKYAVEMGSGATIHPVNSQYHEDWFRHSQVDGGDIGTQGGDRISLL
jgi:hypothetical protein